MVFLINAALTVGAWWYTATLEESRIDGIFRHRATVQLRLARERLQLVAEMVHSIRAFFESSTQVDRAEFADFVRPVLERIPAAHGIDWTPRIGHEQRVALERETAEHQPGFHLWQREIPGDINSPKISASERPEYWPILWSEPAVSPNLVHGFDLSISPLFRPLLDRARAEKSLRLSPRVRLIKQSAADRGSAVIFVEPVFNARSPTAAPDGFIGFVQAIFQIDQLLSKVHRETRDDAVNIAYFDDSAQFEDLRLLYARIDGREYDGSQESTAALPPAAHLLSGDAGESFHFGGRRWRVVLSPNAAWLAGQRTAIPWIVLGGALLLSAAGTMFVYHILHRAAAIEEQVKHRTHELTESRRQLAGLLADMPGMAYRCQSTAPYIATFFSDGVVGLTGYPATDFLSGKRSFGDLIDPNDRIASNRHIDTALASREPYEIEYRLRHRDGRWRHLSDRGRGIFDAEGKPRFLEGLVVDATARKEAEERTREFDRQLLETQKLESLGVLAGGIAHDFNNILTAVLGNASLARGQLPPSSGAAPMLQQIEVAARRAADLCSQMLAYAGKGSLSSGLIDLSALVRETTALLEVSINKGVRLHLQLPTLLPPVNADGTQLRQIVMNLVINASEAIGERPGAITVTTFARAVTANELLDAVQRPDLPSGFYVGLEVHDSGAGISPETLARIFEPFFTTKFSGRGLGLSAVLGIVRSHGGALFVESQPGQGSIFRLLLPAAPTGPQAALPEKPSIPVKAGPGGPLLEATVLIVDDEATVREVSSLALRGAGFEVLAAADGFEALRMCREHSGRIDLILLDLTMPGLSGEETFRRLRAQGAQQKIVLMSGYSSHDAMHRLLQAGATDFIPKPCEMNDLVGRVRQHCS